MKVLSYEAHNVKAISDIDLKLSGRHLYLVGGKNGNGKTSALDALRMALCGKSGMDYPDVSLKEGESEGWVKVALEPDESDESQKTLNIELLLKRKRNGQIAEVFKIVDGEGDEAPEPRALLKRLYHLKGFDPLAFIRLDRKEKKELLQKLVGLDFTELDKEYDKLFKERTDVNREVKTLNSRLSGMNRHVDAPEEEISVSALMSELDRIQAVKAENDRKKDDFGVLVKNNGELRSEVQKTIADIDRLRLKLEEQEKTLYESDMQVAAQKQIVDSLQYIDDGEIKKQIHDADDTNKKVREAKKYREVETEYKASTKRSDDLSEKLEEIIESKTNALKNAKWPIDGLGVDDEGVIYNGLPFEQACKSLQTITSTKIGMALQPRLKLLICEDGSDLDYETLQTLQTILEEEDFQMVLEFVTRGKEDESHCAVIIENGKQKVVDND